MRNSGTRDYLSFPLLQKGFWPAAEVTAGDLSLSETQISRFRHHLRLPNLEVLKIEVLGFKI
jgi:hypothetical protein